MILRKFFGKLRRDFKNIFLLPQTKYSLTGEVDYDTYWHERRPNQSAVLSDWQKQRVDLIKPLLFPGAKVVDLGCGDGAVLAYLQNTCAIHGIGIDFDHNELAKANSLGVETKIIDINNTDELRALPEVDFIIGFEIIEHLPVPEKIIFSLANKVKGGFIFSVPNSGYYAHRLRFLWGRFPLQWVVHPGEHLRFWTVKDMTYWVGSMGFKLNKIFLYEGLPVLNKVFPKLFSQGQIVYFSKK